MAQFLLNGNNNLTAWTNFIILNSTTEYIPDAKNFDEPLFSGLTSVF